MSPIDPTGPLFAQIRAQALAWRRRSVQQQEPSPAEERPTRGAPESTPDFAARVAQSVAAIDPDDPQRQRKAFRIYLKAVLVRECGIRREEDPGFQELVDRVQEMMEGDPRLREAMGAAGAVLLQSAKG